MRCRIACSILLVTLVGCGAPRQTITPGEQIVELGEGEMRADAYLFDCKLKREGRNNSFRLDLFVTDSMAAFYGRGYLGKGVFRGVLRNDSIYIAFPTTHEYLIEAVPNLLRSGECVPELKEAGLLTYLVPVADSIARKERQKGDYAISLDETKEGCAFQLTFRYKEKDDYWHPEELSYSDHAGVELRAKRRELRTRAKLSRDRFDFALPENGVRVSP